MMKSCFNNYKGMGKFVCPVFERVRQNITIEGNGK